MSRLLVVTKELRAVFLELSVGSKVFSKFGVQIMMNSVDSGYCMIR